MDVQKIKLIKIYDMLCKESDENHPMSTYDIIDKLAQSGIEVERKTLYDDINTLNANGFSVSCVRKKCNMYYIDKRAFDTAEIRILMDAVESASFITKSKTKKLVDKLAELAGPLKGEVIKNNIAIFDTLKSDNENIFENVMAINEAIISKKKISFAYSRIDANGKRVSRRKDKTTYVVNPIATVLSNGNYYLVCSMDSHPDCISHYRIDRMDNIFVQPVKARYPADIKCCDIYKQKKQVFDMFIGKATDVTFEIDKSIIEVIFDKFGKASTRLTPYGDKYRFTTRIQVSDMFYGWCFGLGKNLQIIAPRDVRHEYMQKLNEVCSFCKTLDDAD